MYAIMNIKTNKFVYGTDYRKGTNPKNNRTFNQRTSSDKMLTFASLEEAETAFKIRGCGQDYKIVVLQTIQVKKVIERGNNGAG